MRECHEHNDDAISVGRERVGFRTQRDSLKTRVNSMVCIKQGLFCSFTNRVGYSIKNFQIRRRHHRGSKLKSFILEGNTDLCNAHEYERSSICIYVVLYINTLDYGLSSFMS